MKKSKKNNGFTLIELLMVISIIGLLSGVVLTAMGDARSRARNSQRIQNAEAIAKAFQIATTGANNNQFPASVGLQASCLGKPSCWGTADLQEFVGVSSVLNTGFGSNKIPLDPFWRPTHFGDAYTYYSNANLSQGRGAYIYWIMEGQSSQKCGRGIVNGPVQTTNTGGIPSYQCALYLGPPTTPL